MKLKSIVFSTLFGSAMISQLLMMPASAVIPTPGIWQKASAGFNLKNGVREDISRAFAKYYARLSTLDDREKSQPPVPGRNGATIIVRDYPARVKLAKKLQKKLNGFIHKLNPGNPNAVAYLNEVLSEAKEAETVFTDLEHKQIAQLGQVGVAAPVGANAFDEANELESVIDRIERAESEFRALDANPNNVNRFYSQHVRGITLALAPLKHNNPTTYTQIVDGYSNKASQIDANLTNPAISKTRIASQIKSAITILHAALDELR